MELFLHARLAFIKASALDLKGQSTDFTSSPCTALEALHLNPAPPGSTLGVPSLAAPWAPSQGLSSTNPPAKS